MHDLDERHKQGKKTWIDEEHGWVAPGARRAAESQQEVGDEVADAVLQREARDPGALRYRGSVTAEAVLRGWKAVLAEHPSTPRRSRLSLFERAERIGGQDASGWVLYRIVRESEHESPDVAQAPAA